MKFNKILMIQQDAYLHGLIYVYGERLEYNERVEDYNLYCERIRLYKSFLELVRRGICREQEGCIKWFYSWNASLSFSLIRITIYGIRSILNLSKKYDKICLKMFQVQVRRKENVKRISIIVTVGNYHGMVIICR